MNACTAAKPAANSFCAAAFSAADLDDTLPLCGVPGADAAAADLGVAGSSSEPRGVILPARISGDDDTAAAAAPGGSVADRLGVALAGLGVGASCLGGGGGGDDCSGGGGGGGSFSAAAAAAAVVETLLAAGGRASGVRGVLPPPDMGDIGVDADVGALAVVGGGGTATVRPGDGGGGGTAPAAGDDDATAGTAAAAAAAPVADISKLWS